MIFLNQIEETLRVSKNQWAQADSVNVLIGAYSYTIREDLWARKIGNYWQVIGLEEIVRAHMQLNGYTVMPIYYRARPYKNGEWMELENDVEIQQDVLFVGAPLRFGTSVTSINFLLNNYALQSSLKSWLIKGEEKSIAFYLSDKEEYTILYLKRNGEVAFFESDRLSNTGVQSINVSYSSEEFGDVSMAKVLLGTRTFEFEPNDTPDSYTKEEYMSWLLRRAFTWNTDFAGVIYIEVVADGYRDSVPSDPSGFSGFVGDCTVHKLIRPNDSINVKSLLEAAFPEQNPGETVEWFEDVRCRLYRNDGGLISDKITCTASGDRRTEFDVFFLKDIITAENFRFRNVFNVTESMFIPGTVTASPKVEFEEAAQDSKISQYDVERTTEFTFKSGTLPRFMYYALLNFCKAGKWEYLERINNQVTWRYVVITEYDFKLPDSPNEPISLEFKFKYQNKSDNDIVCIV